MKKIMHHNKHIKIFEAYFDDKNLLDEMSKRFFDNKQQLSKFIENIESDPQWAQQPIQSVVNLGYSKWITEEDFPEYRTMIKWCLKQYGPLPAFLIQFLKYFQFIFSDGHLAYYEAGMASSGYEDLSEDLDIHKQMVEKFREFFIDSDLDIENSAEVFKVMSTLKVKVSSGTEEEIKTISNIDELNDLDQKFYDVAVDFVSGLEEFFKEFVRDIKDTI